MWIRRGLFNSFWEFKSMALALFHSQLYHLLVRSCTAEQAIDYIWIRLQRERKTWLKSPARPCPNNLRTPFSIKFPKLSPTNQGASYSGIKPQWVLGFITSCCRGQLESVDKVLSLGSDQDPACNRLSWVHCPQVSVLICGNQGRGFTSLPIHLCHPECLVSRHMAMQEYHKHIPDMPQMAIS